MQALSGSAARKGTQYRYGRALAFLRGSMLPRRTVCSTVEPASEINPLGAIAEQNVTGEPSNRPSTSDHSLPSTSSYEPSLPSTSTSQPSLPSTNPSNPSLSNLPSFPSYPTCPSAYWQTSLHEAGQRVGVPLSDHSDAHDTRTALGSGRQRHSGQNRGSPEFLHLNASIHSFIKVLSDQIIAGFNLVNHSLQVLTSKMDEVLSAVRQTPSQHFFHSVIGDLESLPSNQQIHVMRAFQNAIQQLHQHPPSTTAPHLSTAPQMPPPVHLQPPTQTHQYSQSTIPTHYRNPMHTTRSVQTSLYSPSPFSSPHDNTSTTPSPTALSCNS
ncbi:uncharacterized protein ACNLHF_004850 [Anomaloglossus baeobatrachus]|uniref:uncharacterized protein LOC142265959 n=1 Tax=Anomaloglossus baeobatrachus TaxID=238106 RepID=UPI003F50B6D9